MRFVVCACVLLASCFLGNAQFLGNIFGGARRHPIYAQRFQQAEDILLLSALLGIDLNDRVLWNIITGNNRPGVGPGRGPPRRGRPRTDPFASTLQTLGFIDGPDNPDGRGPAPAGPKRPGAAAGGGEPGEDPGAAKPVKGKRRKGRNNNRKKPAGRG